MRLLLASLLVLLLQGVGLIQADSTKRIWHPDNAKPVKRIIASDLNPKTIAALAAQHELSVNKKPLEEAIDALRQKTELNVVIDWRRLLDQAGIQKDELITMQVNEPAYRLIDLLVSYLNYRVHPDSTGKRVQIGWVAKKGLVQITVVQALRQAHTQRVYAVRELIDADSKSQLHHQLLALENIGKIIDDDAHYPNRTDLRRLALIAMTAQQRLVSKDLINRDEPQIGSETLEEELLSLIQSFLPQDWRGSGGDDYTLGYFQGNMVLKTHQEGHLRIERLFQALRQAKKKRNIQVPIQTLPESLVPLRKPIDVMQKIDVNYDQASFEKVLRDIEQQTGIQIKCEWRLLLDNAGIERKVPVSLKLKQVALAQLLDLILNQVSVISGELEPIDWRSYQGHKGGILISTSERLKKIRQTSIYNVTDLVDIRASKPYRKAMRITSKALKEIRKLVASKKKTASERVLAIAVASQRAIRKAGQSFPQAYLWHEDMPERSEKLIDKITGQVGEFEAWARNGGQYHSVRYLSLGSETLLIIETDSLNHQKIKDFFASLRTTPNPSIKEGDGW